MFLVVIFDSNGYLVGLLVILIAVEGLIHGVHYLLAPSETELSPCEVIEHHMDVEELEFCDFSLILIFIICVSE